MARSWRIPRPRFSLLTLVLGVLFVGACGGLWWRWEPWACDLVLRGHTGLVFGAAFSPDGQRVISSISWDGTARVWNATSGQECLLLALQPGNKIYSTTFSPDGQRILTLSQDRIPRIWDTETDREMAALKGHSKYIHSAAFSPNSRQIVTASEDGTARVWDASTGAELMVLNGHADQVTSAVFSPDGRRIVTASRDGTARMWDASTGKEVAVLGKQGPSNAMSASYSPDGRLILTMAAGGVAVYIWDAATGKQQAEICVAGASRMEFSPDGSAIAAVNFGSVVHVYDAGTFLERALLVGHTGAVNSSTFSPDGKWIATGSYDSTARIWDTEYGRERAVLSGHEATVRSAAFSPDGQRIVTSGDDTVLRVWSRRRPEYVWGIVVLPELWIALLTGGALLTIVARNLRIKRSTLLSLALIVLFASSCCVLWYRWEPWRCDAVLKGTQFGAIYLRGRPASSASRGDRAALAAHAEQFRFTLKRLEEHDIDACYALPSSDGSRFVAWNDNGSVHVWDVSTRQEQTAHKGPGGTVSYAAMSPDEMWVASGLDDGTVHVWNVNSGEERVVLKGHADKISFVAFSDDGRKAITGSTDTTACLWDLETGRQLTVLRGHTQWITFAAFESGSERVYTEGFDSKSRFWSHRRPEYWWGIAWLPEFWVALLSGSAMLLIAVRNLRRRFTQPTAAQSQLPVANSQ